MVLLIFIISVIFLTFIVIPYALKIYEHFNLKIKFKKAIKELVKTPLIVIESEHLFSIHTNKRTVITQYLWSDFKKVYLNEDTLILIKHNEERLTLDKAVYTDWMLLFLSLPLALISDSNTASKLKEKKSQLQACEICDYIALLNDNCLLCSTAPFEIAAITYGVDTFMSKTEYIASEQEDWLTYKEEATTYHLFKKSNTNHIDHKK